MSLEQCIIMTDAQCTPEFAVRQTSCAFARMVLATTETDASTYAAALELHELAQHARPLLNEPDDAELTAVCRELLAAIDKRRDAVSKLSGFPAGSAFYLVGVWIEECRRLLRAVISRADGRAA